MYAINLDENNYVLSIYSTENREVDIYDIDLSQYEYLDTHINAYKWESDSLMFDEERFNILEAERLAQEEAEKQQVSYEQRIKDLESALDLLLSGEVE